MLWLYFLSWQSFCKFLNGVFITFIMFSRFVCLPCLYIHLLFSVICSYPSDFLPTAIWFSCFLGQLQVLGHVNSVPCLLSSSSSFMLCVCFSIGKSIFSNDILRRELQDVKLLRLQISHTQTYAALHFPQIWLIICA